MAEAQWMLLPHTAHMLSLAHKSPAQVSRVSASLARALWIAKWILVLFLAWDQIASPLHQHHHDSGIDASWIGAVKDGASVGGMLHVDDGDTVALFAHATMAVQLQASSGQLSAATQAFALYVAFAEIFDFVQSEEPHAWPAYVAPVYPSFRSLPPGGRAPPLHA
ncbi:hypothetical protein [Acidovorax temperans]|uniref:hypothetical protein n=1 Tax=Acidovorax temperans TaxID=80878 RepID=UPI00391946BF